MKRALIFILSALSIVFLPGKALAQNALTATSTDPLGVVVDSLQTSAASYASGAKIVATTSLQAGGNVTVPMLVAAVRDSQGGNHDFPLLANVALGATAKSFSFSGALTTPGTYTVQMAYYSGSTWYNLSPVRTFSVAAASRASGVYTGWPESPSTLDAFASFRGRAVGIAADYLDSSSWTNIEGPSWFTNTYKSTAYASKLVIGVPMLPTSGTLGSLSSGASGAYDAHFVQLAKNLVAAGLGNSVIRPGWEFNSPGNYPWSGVSQPATFAAYFRHIVTAMRSVNPSFRFDLCFTVAVDGTQLDLSKAWPGDGYVDFIGMDLYDMHPGGGMTASQRWNWYLTAPGGLNYLSSFAATHNKKMSFDEWALASPSWGGGGDDPYYIQAMHDWMTTHPVAFEVYNNVHYTYTNGKLDDGSYPQASALYRSLFGG
jgi:hypothetical protein